MNLEQLNSEFSLDATDNHLSIRSGVGDIPVVVIDNSHSSAAISLQGAHLLSWIPKGEKDVIWLSEDATFARGKSVRGGVPICWPWFGAHGSEGDFPAHGFARTTDWQILKTQALADGRTLISFVTHPREETGNMWPTDTSVQLTVFIGSTLEMELITHNNGDEAITIGQALHTYFNVGDINDTVVQGLDETCYLDKPDDFKNKRQQGPVRFEQEVDRIYLDTTNDCTIEDSSLERNIVIRKRGSRSTVVWNPWQAVAEKMGDLGHDGYKNMLCVEVANAAEDVVIIEPGRSHQLWVQYELQKV